MSDLLAALAPVVRTLDALAVAYYVGGSLASSAHGVARSSLDVDLIAALQPVHVRPFVAALQGSYYLDSDRIETSVRDRRAFNLVHLDTMFKVDVFVLRDRPFDREALRRARAQVLGEGPETLRVPVATAEDTVLAKLEWFRAGGEVSERQWADVVGILKVGGPVTDEAYLRQWAPALGVSDLLDRALSVASGPA
jgi:hypothetical protein